MTYTLPRRKEKAPGLLLFATPSYMYLSTGESRNFNQSGGSGVVDKMKSNVFNLYSVKAGLGLAF